MMTVVVLGLSHCVNFERRFFRVTLSLGWVLSKAVHGYFPFSYMCQYLYLMSNIEDLYALLSRFSIFAPQH